MTSNSSTDVVTAWHEAVNAQDVPAALALCHPDVAVGGPQGVGTGRDRMQAWLQRSGISLEPRGPVEEKAGRVVVHEGARWRAPDAPAEVPTQEAVDTWVVFEVAEGLITSVRRYETPQDVPSA